jgi:hypothetical protein
MLSAAKHLWAHRARPFASLRVTLHSRSCLLKLIIYSHREYPCILIGDTAQLSLSPSKASSGREQEVVFALRFPLLITGHDLCYKSTFHMLYLSIYDLISDMALVTCVCSVFTKYFVEH